MADESVEFSTSLPVDLIADIFSNTLRSLDKKVEFGVVRSDSNDPFAQFSSLDFGAYASCDYFISTKNWALQIYVVDEGPQRLVALVNLGDSGLKRAWLGAKNSYSKKGGEERISAIISALRSNDSGLKVVY